MIKRKKRGSEEELLSKLKDVVNQLEKKPSKQAKDEMNSLKSKLNETLRTNAALEREIAKRSDNGNRLRISMEKVQKDQKPLENSLKIALKQNIILEKNLVSKTEILRELKQENQDLMNQQRLLEDDLIKQGKLNDELIQKIELVESQIDQKDQQVKHLNMDIKVLNEKLTNSNQEILSLKKAVYSEKNKFSLLDDQNKALLVHLSKAKETIENLNAIVEQLKNDLNEKTKSILNSHAKAELNMKIENDILRKKIADLQSLLEAKDRKQQEVINYLNSGLDAVKNV